MEKLNLRKTNFAQTYQNVDFVNMVFFLLYFFSPKCVRNTRAYIYSWAITKHTNRQRDLQSRKYLPLAGLRNLILMISFSQMFGTDL